MRLETCWRSKICIQTAQTSLHTAERVREGKKRNEKDAYHPEGEPSSCQAKVWGFRSCSTSVEDSHDSRVASMRSMNTGDSECMREKRGRAD